MSDLERVTRTDRSVDSLPAPETSQANYISSAPVSPRLPGRTSNRVTVGYFDRAGVDQLRRTLTHLSETYDPENARALSSETLSVPAAGPFDFEKTLRTIMKKYVITPIALSSVTKSGTRRDRAGIQPRELGVMFKDLHVVGLGAAASFQPTFGSMFNPKAILENIQTLRHPPLRDILTGFEGVVRPGEMLRS